jgi:hypothetical protein
MGMALHDRSVGLLEKAGGRVQSSNRLGGALNLATLLCWLTRRYHERYVGRNSILKNGHEELGTYGTR